MTGFLTELNSRNIKSIVLNHARRHQPHETNAKRITNNSRNEGSQICAPEAVFHSQKSFSQDRASRFQNLRIQVDSRYPKKGGNMHLNKEAAAYSAPWTSRLVPVVLKRQDALRRPVPSSINC